MSQVRIDWPLRYIVVATGIDTIACPIARLRTCPVPDVPLWVVLLAFAAFLLAGFVKGFIGMGLPAIATGLLTMMMAPGQAAALLVMPNAATNAWQALTGKHLGGLLRRVCGLLPSAWVCG